MSEVLRYPSGVLIGDYARAAAGLALTVAPLALVNVSPWIGAPLALSALLFAAFAARTAQRQLTRVTMDEEGVRAEGPLGATIRWNELTGLRLRYYTTRRDRTDGWMQASLHGTSGRIRLDSTLDGFDAVIERAALASRRNGLNLSKTTLDNLLALGIDPEDWPEDPPEGQDA